MADLLLGPLDGVIYPSSEDSLSDTNPLMAFTVLRTAEADVTDLKLDAARRAAFDRILDPYLPADDNTRFVIQTKWGGNVMTYVYPGLSFTDDKTDRITLEIPDLMPTGFIVSLRSVVTPEDYVERGEAKDPSFGDLIEQRLLLSCRLLNGTVRRGATDWVSLDVRHKGMQSKDVRDEDTLPNVVCSFFCPGWQSGEGSDVRLPRNVELCHERTRKVWLERLEKEVKEECGSFISKREETQQSRLQGEVPVITISSF